MEPPSYMRSVVDRNVVMLRIPIVSYWRLGSTHPSYLQNSNSSKRMIRIGFAETLVKNCAA